MAAPDPPADERLAALTRGVFRKPPWLFLDVDGVVNVPAVGGGAGWGDFAMRRLGDPPLPARLSPSMCAALAVLPIELVWATTSLTMADGYLDALERATGLSGRRPPLRGGDEKPDVVRRWVADDPRPYIWVDDDACALPAAPSQLLGDPVGPPHLRLQPDPDRGLSVAELGCARAFLAAVGAAERRL